MVMLLQQNSEKHQIQWDLPSVKQERFKQVSLETMGGGGGVVADTHLGGVFRVGIDPCFTPRHMLSL